MLSPFVSNVVTYVAGWVIRKLTPRIRCADCRMALVSTPGDYLHESTTLLAIKNNGGLLIPSTDVVTILEQTERIIRSTMNIHKAQSSDNWSLAIINKVLFTLPRNMFLDYTTHFRDTLTGIDSHYTDLVRQICTTYITLRRYHVINITNQQLKGSSVRHRLTKAIIFKHQ